MQESNRIAAAGSETRGIQQEGETDMHVGVDRGVVAPL